MTTASSEYGVQPITCTRRDCRCSTNRCSTSPALARSTCVVKKSAATSAGQWACTNVRRPSALAAGCAFNVQDARDRRTTDAVTQVLQRVLNVRVAPRWVLSRRRMTSARRCACRPAGRPRPARYVHCVSPARGARAMLSGVTMAATCASSLRPSRCPNSARRRRSLSSKRKRCPASLPSALDSLRAGTR